VYTTKQDVTADKIGTHADSEARPKFRTAHTWIGFGVLLLVSSAVMVYLVRAPAGPHRPLVWVMVAIWFGAATGVCVAASINRTRIEEHERGLRAELAGIDELTGCSVRRVLGQHMDQEIERASRTGRPLSLVMIDVDEFKTVNDEYGHVVADRLLMSIGAILLANVRSFDVASRLGVDEFALLLPEIDTSGAVIVAERICRDLAGCGGVRVTLSIGVSGLNPSMPTAERLVAEAGMALDQVKRAGRDAIAVRSPGPLLTW
jgi:diguanylate cyclase (GGDEF)-like protein